MSEVRKFRKGDKLKTVGDREKVEESTFVYEVVGDETEGGQVRVKLIEQYAGGYNSRGDLYSTSVQKSNARTLRRWELIEEGPAKRPNNRVTKIKAVDIRLGETIRYYGETFLVNRKQGLKGVWLISEVGGRRISIPGTDDVEVLGKRGRPMPKTVHFNRYTDPGMVIVQYNDRPSFGSFACGVVSNISIFASSRDLVTCEQKCGEECREHHFRKGTK